MEDSSPGTVQRCHLIVHTTIGKIAMLLEILYHDSKY